MEMNSYQWPTERYIYGQKPSTSKLYKKSLTSASSIYGRDKPLFHYINNPTEHVNYIEIRGRKPSSNTYNSRQRYRPNLRWG
ncbi:hypothetical protein EPI10_031735 [Gossypium australe]|uniref:Uncharacterized protein n=1 Tax=Gossypium australe TaxID=47621 RepID=A0A5B6X3T8_9ROSI|nr:hypothetical protein EPI10_031735 [Gossypium australe]